MIETDYLTRQIDIVIRSIGVLLPINWESKTVETISPTGKKLCNLLQKGDINRAENLLFEYMENEHSQESLITSLLFYRELNNKTAKELKELNYSKEEMLEAFDEIKNIFQIQF